MKQASTRASAWVASIATANVISWQAAALILGALVVSGLLGLLNEWQRRKTIQALISSAPEGAIVVLTEAPAGQSVTVRMGPAVRPRLPSAGS
jgi:hypothetical protein